MPSCTATVSLGRDKWTDKRIRLKEMQVSKTHANLFWLDDRDGEGAWAIADTGSLTQPTNFLIRINQIPGSSRPPIAATPSSETFASNLALRGTSARTFAATGNGQVTLRIQNLGASDALVDLGFGIPRSDGSGCLIAQTVRGGVGSQISTPVDLGPYCVVITDFGNLTAPTSFSINITKP